MESNSTLNPNSIVNILTLRYDPSLPTQLSKKTWKDFQSLDIVPDIDYIENLLQENILKKLNSVNTKKLCIALSGGVDSTLVLSLIRKYNPDIEIDAISIRFANSVDETTSASKIAETFEANHHIISLENYLSELPKAISLIKLPFWDLHWYYVAKKAKSLSNILASGDGGDEIFSGYTFRYKKFLSITNSDSTPLDKVKAYLSCHERDRVPDQKFLFGERATFSWDSVYKSLLPYFDNPLSRLEQVFVADYNGKLMYNFNPINSRIVKHFNIEVLAPLLNENIISYGLQILTKFKYDTTNNVGKLPLRKLLEKNNANSLISKEKLGFNVNTINLWKSHGHKLCKEFLENPRIVQEGWINNDWIQKYIDKPDLDVKYVNKFLGLLAFEIWYRLFITKEISSDDKLD
ncbi:asparagine synthase-related protein [Nitrosopumilus sp.]|uniref:asparagine synthase-related protein n=1 Tax=Nitrosopumilus sp. TaxID=2024843 RepID=UPI003D0E2877